MFQRQILDLETSDDVAVLGISNLNSGAVLLEESVGDGRIVAMDLVSPVRPWYNSWGSTNKYLFLGNVVNNAVRYGKHYPERLSYDGFVDLMFDTVEGYPELHLEDEGRSSDGRPVYSLNVGEESNPTMYFGAAIHGWEWENAYGLLRLAEILCQSPNVEGLETRKLHFKMLPVQNPGGFDRFTRQNSRGVDLNRNFDCHWGDFHYTQDVRMPWDYNYMGTEPASERETRIIQRIIDRCRPLCVIDFHTADYIMMLSHKGDGELLSAIHTDIRDRLKNRYLTQKPYAGAYQQVNMDRITNFRPPEPYCISYAAERGVPAAFLIEMSGNRDDVHALVMNTDTVVEVCLAAVKQCLFKGDPTVIITDIDLFEVEIPPIPPIARYHPKIYSITLCRVHTDGGIEGVGECQGEPARFAEKAAALTGQDPLSLDPFEQPDPFTCALLDVAGQAYGIPVWRFFGEKVRDRIPRLLLVLRHAARRDRRRSRDWRETGFHQPQTQGAAPGTSWKPSGSSRRPRGPNTPLA